MGDHGGQSTVHSMEMLKCSTATRKTRSSSRHSHSHDGIEVINASLSKGGAEFPWKLTAENSRAIEQYLEEELVSEKKGSSAGCSNRLHQNEAEGCWSTLTNYVNTIW